MPATDKERERERKKKYWATNRERLLAYHKEYIRKNRNISRRKQKKYWATNPEKAQEHNRIRRARKHKVKHVPYTKEQVLEKYGTNCHICGDPIDLKAPRALRFKGWEYGLHLDHVIPISKGGPDTIENVRPSHGICNMSKGNKK